MNVNLEIARLENKRQHLHTFITEKLEEKGYHAVADAAMDLIGIDARLKTITEIFDWSGLEKKI